MKTSGILHLVKHVDYVMRGRLWIHTKYKHLVADLQEVDYQLTFNFWSFHGMILGNLVATWRTSFPLDKNQTQVPKDNFHSLTGVFTQGRSYSHALQLHTFLSVSLPVFYRGAFTSSRSQWNLWQKTTLMGDFLSFKTTSFFLLPYKWARHSPRTTLF